MDSNIQIQTLKSKIENMKLQIDNISIQNNNNMFMMNNPIGGQLINLSMQMLNTGIQTFNIGKILMINMNLDNFYEQLKKISEQINSMINEYDIQLNQQEQMMMMNQQMVMQQQMIMQQQLKVNQNQANFDTQSKYINIQFENDSLELINMIFKYGTSVKDALNQYIIKAYGFSKDKIIFFYNGCKINKNELSKIENFINFSGDKIQVVEEERVVG